MEYFDFSEALRLLKQGNQLRREDWHKSIYYIYLVGDTLAMRTNSSPNDITDFEIFKDDILATDWYLYNVTRRKHLISEEE